MFTVSNGSWNFVEYLPEVNKPGPTRQPHSFFFLLSVDGGQHDAENHRRHGHVLVAGLPYISPRTLQFALSFIAVANCSSRVFFFPQFKPPSSPVEPPHPGSVPPVPFGRTPPGQALPELRRDPQRPRRALFLRLRKLIVSARHRPPHPAPISGQVRAPIASASFCEVAGPLSPPRRPFPRRPPPPIGPTHHPGAPRWVAPHRRRARQSNARALPLSLSLTCGPD
jgi:hypothetical protein